MNSGNVDTSPKPEALRQGYEPPDVSIGGVMVFFLCFVLLGVVVQLGSWWLLKVYISAPRSVDVQTSAAPAVQRFPPPNLQPTEQHTNMPYQDLAELRQEKAEIFQQMGWAADPATGSGKIPDDIVARLAKEHARGNQTSATQNTLQSNSTTGGNP